MTAPNNNSTMMDININEKITLQRHREPITILNKNIKKTSEIQANDTKNDETIISFDKTEEMNNQTPLMRKIKHGVDITFKNKKYTTHHKPKEK